MRYQLNPADDANTVIAKSVMSIFYSSKESVYIFLAYPPTPDSFWTPLSVLKITNVNNHWSLTTKDKTEDNVYKLPDFPQTASEVYLRAISIVRELYGEDSSWFVEYISYA